MDKEILTEEDRTPERIDQTYRTALKSVALINEIVASGDTDQESVDTLKRNRDFLDGLLEYDYWTTEDLSPLQAALVA
jgi:hypothetical protein